MAKRDDVFPSKYLRAADLNGEPLVVTIASAPTETLKSPDGKEQTKTVLYLHGVKKRLPLNITNWNSVADIAGDDSDNWPGARVELYPAKTEMKGKTVDCIRVREPRQLELPGTSSSQKPTLAKAKAKAKVKAIPAKHDEMDDEIPFA